MWVNMQRAWEGIKLINNKLVWISHLLLFFSSFFPYTTSLVSSHFDNTVAQSLYGIVVLLVSLTNVCMYDELVRISTREESSQVSQTHNRLMIWDIALKCVGFILTITIYPPAMMWSVLIADLVVIIPRSL